MPLATLAVGVVSGVVGIVLVLVLHLVQHTAFGYTENDFLYGVLHASPLRRVLAPTLGGVLVGLGWWWQRRRWSTDDVSVTRALRDTEHRMPIRPTVVDALLQVVAVGVGASLGREGAPRQAAAAVAGWLGERLRLTTCQRRTLLACGAGAGLAAVYNVPLAGAVFTLETLLVSLALRDVAAAVVTSAVATLVTWPVLGNHPTYQVGPIGFSWSVLVWAVPMGVAAGALGVGFERLMTLARTHRATGRATLVATPLAFATVGAAAVAFPQLPGNGKGPAELAFVGGLGLLLAAVLVLLKPLATAVCLAGGAIGGLLTPALATGALAGLVGGRLWQQLWPGVPLGAFAIVGAAAVLAATQRAPLTALVITWELVRTGYALLPALVVAVALALAVAHWLGRTRRSRMERVRPSLYEHAGGKQAFLRLSRAMNVRCLADPELRHAFLRTGHPQHDERLAAYWAEVLGGPPAYTGEHGGDQTTLVRMHAGEHEPDEWRQRFVDCFVAALDDAELPDDPDFRAAMRAYMEWAVTGVNAYPESKDDVPEDLAMPRWGWDGLVSPPASLR
ncbi:chloride channel protein [Nocardioides mangrovicus]|nr:chloride channel protein [Nocardioides mangrovicus]